MTRVGKVLVTLVLLAVIVAEGYCVAKIGVAEPSGIWKDVNDDYYIVFRGNSEYSDSTYGVLREVEVQGDDVIFYDIVGEQSVTTPRKNFGSTVEVTLNGVTRTMAPYHGAPKTADWNLLESMNCTGAYKLKGDIGLSMNIRLFDNAVAVVSVAGDVNRCKFALDANSNLFLFWRDSDYVDCLRPWSMGYVCGNMDSSVTSELISGGALRDRGYSLLGTASYDAADVTYIFIDKTSVIRKDGQGNSSDFLYYADANGLITMTDMTGLGVRDYLYIDTETGAMYRYVLEMDEWYDYIMSMG